ncbi:Bug family tripartite tricarboxylate transporter substrate binding protein [Aidingimonas lacisalsi]|uniref:Bug family tripartite tricarboxylate transporter substrate binding protein n=1 Tax=Aidingimonas lacisalsi TaxID=2604086 RepID=UPI00191C31DB|nr:tripartite tricarboxylate transporter substrate binding protein [Aidingimonas lacisalsi]
MQLTPEQQYQSLPPVGETSLPTRMSVLKPALGALVFGIALAGITNAQAQSEYPDDTVEFIVPWSPGGGSDTLMRVVAENVDDHLGQSMQVINMPGVSGTTGLEELSDRDPDGYTVGQVHEGLMVAHHTGLTDINWDDFTPIASMTASPQYLTVNADDDRWSNVDEFIDFAKDNPGEIRFGVTLGGIPHVHAAMIADAENLDFRYVGFEGTGERIRALVGGNIDAAMGDIASSGEFVKNGDLQFLAVGSDERIEETPDVPTFNELGYESLDLNIVRGLVAPEGTPEERIDVLAEAMKSLADDKAFIEGINNAGAEVLYNGPSDYSDYLETTNETIERLSGELEK